MTTFFDSSKIISETYWKLLLSENWSHLENIKNSIFDFYIFIQIVNFSKIWDFIEYFYQIFTKSLLS